MLPVCEEAPSARREREAVHVLDFETQPALLVVCAWGDAEGPVGVVLEADVAARIEGLEGGGGWMGDVGAALAVGGVGAGGGAYWDAGSALELD